MIVCVYTTFYISIHLSLGIWVCFLLWAVVKCCCEHGCANISETVLQSFWICAQKWDYRSFGSFIFTLWGITTLSLKTFKRFFLIFGPIKVNSDLSEHGSLPLPHFSPSTLSLIASVFSSLSSEKLFLFFSLIIYSLVLFLDYVFGLWHCLSRTSVMFIFFSFIFVFVIWAGRLL